MAETTIQNGPGENLVAKRTTFFGASQDDYTEAPAQDPDKFELLQNVMPPLNGTVDRRWGFNEFSNPSLTTRRMYSVYFPVSYDVNGNATTADGRLRVILTASDGNGLPNGINRVVAINHVGGVINTLLYTPGAGADHPHVTMANTYLYAADGTAAGLHAWNGFDTQSAGHWGLTPLYWLPPEITVVNGTEDTPLGDLNLKEGRKYTIAGRNSKTGVTTLARDPVSGLVPFTEISGPVAFGYIQFPMTAIAGAPQNILDVLTFNSQGIDELVLLATADGGDTSILYQVLKVAAGGLGALHLYSDAKREDILLEESNIWAEIDEEDRGRGLYAGWDPATIITTGKIPTYHRGRIYLLANNKLYYSASLDDVTTSTGLIATRPETTFSPSNVIELSTQDNENGVGVLSDGVNLYIGTVQSIRAMGGDPPNQDGPHTLYANAGLLNQQVWRRVWHAGKASGAIWVTPDRMVVASDGNTYRDIGRDIQDTLARVTSTAFAAKAHAAFMTDGQQELYVLALPVDGATECNLLAVYSITSDCWVTWDMTAYDTNGTAFPTTVTAMNGEMVPWLTPYAIGGPIGYFASGTYSQLFKFDFDGVQDYVSGSNPIGYSTRAVLRTGWLAFDSPESIKYLRMIDIMSAETASNITLKVEGAFDVADFESPTTLLQESMRTTLHNKKYHSLMSVPARYRFYRFTLTFLPTDTKDILNYLSIEFRPSHRAY